MTDGTTPRIPDLTPGDLRFPIDVRIPSDIGYIEGIVAVVATRCAEQHFSPDVCNLNVRVALTEALSNAIRYGNGDDCSKVVRFRATLADHCVVFEVTDEGVGFDLSACTRDPTLLENLTREDGRGLFLMQRLMDRVERLTDGGNVVRLTLCRP